MNGKAKRYIVYTSICMLLLLAFQTFSQPGIMADTTMRTLKFSSGSFIAGAGYGVVPYVYQSEPEVYLKTEGSSSLLFFGIPFNTNFSYSGINRNASLSDYFRFSFDFNKYKKQKLDAAANQLKSIDYQIRENAEKRQSLLVRKHALDYALRLEEYKKSRDPKDLLDVAVPKSKQSYSDTLQFPNLRIDRDSLKWLQKLYQDSLTLLEAQNQRLQLDKSRYADVDSLGNPKGKYGKTKFIDALQKLDIGRCSPAYSQYLVSNVALRGISFELQYDKIYLAGAVGKVQTTYAYDRNRSADKWYKPEQVLDFVNFKDVSEGNKVVSIKTGFGQKSGTHFFIGGLYGKGLAGNRFIASTSAEIVKNYVWEVDGKLVITNNLSVQGIVARSYQIQQQTLSLSHPDTIQRYYSAAIGKIDYNIEKIKLKLSGQVRYTGPFFKSLGLGYINSNQLSKDIRADKSFWDRVFVNSFYSKTQSGYALSLGTYVTTDIYSLNGVFKLSKKLSLRSGIQKTKVLVHSNEFKRRNLNTNLNFGATYNLNLNKFLSVCNLNYASNEANYFNQTSLQQVYTLTISTTFSNRVNLSLNSSFIHYQTDTASNPLIKTYEVSSSTAILKNKCRLSLSLRIRQIDSSTLNGGAFKLGIPITRSIEGSLSVDKNMVMRSFVFQESVQSVYPYNYFIQVRYRW